MDKIAVTPLAGVWIEITYIILHCTYRIVTPLAGVWVPYHSKDLKKGLEQAILKGRAKIALPPEREVSRMDRLFYPAVFHRAEEGGFWVTFPDIPECMTQGDDMQQAYEMAVDALGLSLTTMEEKEEELPKASEPEDIKTEDGFLVVVQFNLADYRRKHCSRAVKKTLSIPEWLNDAAVKSGVNFSQVLQEALLEKVK